MSIVNTVGDNYFKGDGTIVNPAMNKSLFGWDSEPWIKEEDFTGLQDETEMSDTLTEYTSSQANPKSYIGDIAETSWSVITTGWHIMLFLFETLYNSTLNVGNYINTLGRNDNFKMFDDSIAVVLTLGINFVYMIGLYQMVSNRNLKEGA